MTATNSTQGWAHILGAHVRRARIDEDLTQAEVAAKANISPKTVASLEAGHGTSTTTLIKVLRALNREHWIQTLAPRPDIDPLAAVRQQTERQRASRKD